MKQFSQKVLIIGGAITVVVFALLAMKYFGSSNMKSKVFIGNFDATEKYYAIPVRLDNGQFSVSVFNSHTQEMIQLVSKTRNVSNPKFSLFNDEKLFVSVAESNKELTQYRNVKTEKRSETDKMKRNVSLMKCDLRSRTCSKVLSMEKNIHSPIELENGRLLFVASPAVEWADPFAPDLKIMRYTKNDFHVREINGEIKQLSDAAFFSLEAVNFTGDRLIFSGDLSGYSPYREFEKIQGYSPDGDSNILQLPFDQNDNSIEFDKDSFWPMVKVGKKFDTKPSTIPGSSIITFESAENRKKGGKINQYYDIIIYDYRSKKILRRINPVLPQSFSRPILVANDKIRFLELVNNEIHFFEYDISKSKQIALAKISVEKFIRYANDADGNIQIILE